MLFDWWIWDFFFGFSSFLLIRTARSRSCVRIRKLLKKRKMKWEIFLPAVPLVHLPPFLLRHISYLENYDDSLVAFRLNFFLLKKRHNNFLKKHLEKHIWFRVFVIMSEKSPEIDRPLSHKNLAIFSYDAKVSWPKGARFKNTSETNFGRKSTLTTTIRLDCFHSFGTEKYLFTFRINFDMVGITKWMIFCVHSV